MGQSIARVTMSGIAKRAGVSRTTVSYVVNGLAEDRNISDDTRRSVVRVMREMNYRPDILAQALQGARTRTIGVLWSLTGYNPITAMVNQIALMAKRNNYVSYLSDHMNECEPTLQALEDFASRRVDAVVIDANKKLLRDKKVIQALQSFVAVVTITPVPVKTSFDIIVHNRGNLFYEAALHLLATGKRRLAVAMPLLSYHEPKLIAVRRAIREQTNKPKPLIEIRYELDYPVVEYSSHFLLDELISRFPRDVPFDALLCTSDEEAAHAMNWLKKKGLAVPDDVAVVGANNTEFGRLMSPPLATGIRNDNLVAAEIERMLFGRLNNPDLPPQQAKVEMNFLWRDSAGRLAKLNEKFT